ncbi:hypothetical protein [Kocuria rosea]|uniref:hypothetical protein n=1 Tax=Kocuria rosea TaxID=1275 RepID=UPI003D3261D0
MTNAPARVPFVLRQRFERELRNSVAARALTVGCRYNRLPIEDVCSVVYEVHRRTPWATVGDVAAELSHMLGRGTGAQYRVWAAAHAKCTCSVGWVSYSEVGPHPTEECPRHQGVATRA